MTESTPKIFATIAQNTEGSTATLASAPEKSVNLPAAVLLAAGEGSRLGGMPKSLLTLNGQSLLARQVAALRLAGIHQIVVVTGYFHALIEAELKPLHVDTVRNPQPEAGQQSSVRLGLSKLRAPFDFTFITLADQPLLNAEDFVALTATFAQRQPSKEIRYPVVKGQRGNPVAISRNIVSLILAADSSVTCRDFIQQHPELVDPYPTDNEHFIIDIDTVDDLAAFKVRTGVALQRPA
ncbi:MAG: nucleotidyltransferase family protein [Alcaligenaceae bacterium]